MVAGRGLTGINLVLLLFSLADCHSLFKFLSGPPLSDPPSERCSEECESGDLVAFTQRGEIDPFCDTHCSKNQCQRGCHLLQPALEHGCHQVCAVGAEQSEDLPFPKPTEHYQSRYCVRGCVLALDKHTTDVMDKFNSDITSPTLFNRSSSSLTLSWDTPILPDVVYRVHKRLVTMDTRWQFHSDAVFDQNGSKIEINGLQSYTSYLFKVVMVMSSLPDSVRESPETGELTTLPHGSPATPPELRTLTSPSPYTLYLSWAPPPFGHGRILTYRIYLRSVNQPSSDVLPSFEVPWNKTNWLVPGLQPGQEYNVSLTAVNSEGEGPRSERVIRTRAPSPTSSDDLPYLVLGAGTRVTLTRHNHGSNAIVVSESSRQHTGVSTGTRLSDGRTEYVDFRLDEGIADLAVHVRNKMVFVVQRSGAVSLISLNDNRARSNAYPSVKDAKTVSVDWLSDFVYLASTDQIFRCPLEGDHCVTVARDLKGPLGSLSVDPVNGFLFYVITGRGQGLYRLSLDPGTRNQISPRETPPGLSPIPELIVRMNDLVTLVVDFQNVQIYLLNSATRKVTAAALDGSGVRPVASFTTRLNAVTRIALYNQSLIWSDGSAWYTKTNSGSQLEEPLSGLGSPLSGFCVLHSSTQQTPVPSEAPIDLEAVFHTDKAIVQWKYPVVEYQGEGAYRNWTYQLQLVSSSSKENNPSDPRNFTVVGLGLTITNLQPDTEYTIKIRATSAAGDGPWSVGFIGRTLADGNVKIILAQDKGTLVERDLEGDSERLIFQADTNIQDIDWHEDHLLLLTENNLLLVYNRTSQEQLQLFNTESAVSVAYDWLGLKIYWSELNQDMNKIQRSDSSGSRVEFVCQVLAYDIATDPGSGRLYWTTRFSIGSSYLNGEDVQEVLSLPLYSDTHIVSLTVDIVSKKVVWYVLGYNTQDIFMTDAPQLGDRFSSHVTPVRVGGCRSISSTSNLQFFTHHMLWLSKKNSLLLGDTNCNNSAHLSQQSHVTSFVVTHPSLHPSLASVAGREVKVIPESLKPGNIRTQGVWSTFNLTWSPPVDLIHGTVFYKLLIDRPGHRIALTTVKNYIEMMETSPYVKMFVSIQPYTYWGYADVLTLTVRSPMAIPSAPLLSEVNIIHHKNLTTHRQSLAADFRWEKPQNPNGIISHYLVTHWAGNGSQVTEKVKGTTQHFVLTPISEQNTYYFKVSACTPVGCGPESQVKSANAVGVYHTPTLLYATSQAIYLAEVTKNYSARLIVPDVEARAINFMGQNNPRIYWINTGNEICESVDSFVQEVLVVNNTARDLSVDWVSRSLFIAESVGPELSQVTEFNVDSRQYRTVVSRTARITSLAVNPYSSTLYWVEVTSKGQGQLMTADLRSNKVRVLLGGKPSRGRRDTVSQLCSCSQDLNIAPLLALAYREGGGEPEIILANADTGAIFATDVEGCLCSTIVGPTRSDSFGLPPSLLAIDRTQVSWYNKTEARLYSLARSSVVPMVQIVQDVQDLVAYRPHQQPIPDPDCLDPGAMTSVPDLRSVGNTSLILQLAQPVRPTSCLAISQPHFKFTVYYREVKDTETGVTPDGYDSDGPTFNKQDFYSSQVKLENLQPFTRYMIQAAVSSFYVDYRALTLTDPVFVTTSVGVPGEARNFTALPSNPEVIRVSWWPALKLNGPIEGTVYIIQLSVVVNGTTMETEVEHSAKDVTDRGKFEVSVKKLRHNSLYTVRILTCGSNKTLCSATVPIECQTFAPPSDIQLLNATAHSLKIIWKSPEHINRHLTIYAKVVPGKLDWVNLNTLSITKPSTEYIEEVTSLEPNTVYAIAIRVVYKGPNIGFYIWPPDETRFSFRTLVSHPEQPAPPTITHLSSREYEVRWQEPRDNGAPILSYILQQSNTGGATWETTYNGSADHWLVDRSVLQHGKSYVYRVAALSSEGMSSFSDNSSVLLAPFALEATQNNDVTMGVVVGIVAALAAVLVAAAIVFHRRRARNKIPQFVIHGPDKELATLRELPHTTFQQSNSLYAINILCTDEEIAKLPHFSRSQLLLTMFLGSGAFGEVFEGLARNIRGDRGGETRCAVKTLRKSATEQEKEEFLKEALLMKNFKHEHILGLLGVCLDNDPQFIIMELMEGGDLLSFLRSFRATVTSPAKLVLPDLVKICLHVARGCKYLEEMHFVHRDLAARNCLVSTKSPADMVVKIGDFGLARDIYKNDYYRKEGEGLLPVRWMSPESLVDGFFTTQSDIWAFGVLMWEVVTLGQQPYPARTNIEVLHFVRDRGKLERPDKCAEEMYYLMSKCWSFLPNNRPSFASLVQKLEMFQEKCRQMTPEELALYTPVFNSAQHDAMESLSEDEEEEEEEEKESVRRGLFAPQSRPITGGGSVRLTQSGKQKRLTDLLGSTDTPEKLVVDLSKTSRKRTQSLEDSKLKSSQGLIEPDTFPTASNYDHNGYLEPRGAKGGSRYLELMNYAPEVFHLRDPYGNLLVSGSSNTVLPVHLNHKGYHPNNPSYTLLSPEEDTEDLHCQIKETDILDDDSSDEEEKRLYTPSPVRKPKGSTSLQASPLNSYPWEKSQYSQSKGRKLTPCSAKKSVTPPATTKVRSPPHRKFSEQDLHSSPGSYPHSRFSPTDYRQGPRYSTAESNNNKNNNNHRSISNGKVRVTESGNDGISSHRNGSSNGLYAFADQSGDCLFSVTLPSKSDSGLPRHGQDPWVSSTDRSITDDCSQKQSLNSDTATLQAHINHSSRSRGQIFPESSTAVVGYDLNHVSLV